MYVTIGWSTDLKVKAVLQLIRNELEDLREVLISKGICPECKREGSLWKDPQNGEVVCQHRKCGMVVTREFNPLIRCSGVGNIGRSDAPVNDLCFGRDLGNTDVNSRGNSVALYQVLGKDNKEDLGIRAIKIRNECMASQETSITQRMKNYLSNWCKQYGWGDHVLLSNSLGMHAKWIGSLLTMLDDGTDSKEFARSIMVLDVQKFFGDEKAEKIALELGVKNLFVKKTRSLLQLDKLVT